MNQSIKEQIIEVCGKDHGDLADKILSYEKDIEEELTKLVIAGQRDLAAKILDLRKLLREEGK